MILQYYVIESVTGKHINIEVDAASKDDLEITRGGWQTVWDTDFILDPQKEKYVAKTEEGEIVALGAYRVREGSVAVYIAYIESQPESNPTLTRQRSIRALGKPCSHSASSFRSMQTATAWLFLKQKQTSWNSIISGILAHVR